MIHDTKDTQQHTRSTQYQPLWQSAGYQCSAMPQQVVRSHLNMHHNPGAHQRCTPELCTGLTRALLPAAGGSQQHAEHTWNLADTFAHIPGLWIHAIHTTTVWRRYCTCRARHTRTGKTCLSYKQQVTCTHKQHRTQVVINESVQAGIALKRWTVPVQWPPHERCEQKASNHGVHAEV